MKPKNTICHGFDKDAHEAARFYSATFTDSKVTAVHEASSDCPDGKKGDVLTMEFTVLGIPCLGLNGGPFRHNEAFSFQIATENQESPPSRLPAHRCHKVHDAERGYDGNYHKVFRHRGEMYRWG